MPLIPVSTVGLAIYLLIMAVVLTAAAFAHIPQAFVLAVMLAAMGIAVGISVCAGRDGRDH